MVASAAVVSSPARRALLERLAARWADRREGRPLRIAIDGVDAAGKTTLADELAPILEARGRPVIRASVDGFLQPAAVRWARGDLSPEGYYHDSFDLVALRANLLDPLGPGGSRRIRRRVFDSATDRATDTPFEDAPADAILLLDGVFLLRPALRLLWDDSVFVRADFTTTVARARRRDAARLGSPDEVERRYRERYVPGQRVYLESVDPERHAGVVIANDDPERPVWVRSGRA